MRSLLHPLNLLMVASLGTSAFLVGSWIPLLVGAIAELGWLVLAPRYLPAKRSLPEAPARAQVNALGEEDRRRYLELERTKGEIARLVASGDATTRDLLAAELPKLDHLIEAFLRVASTASRYEAIARASDLDRLEEDVRRQRKIVEKAPDPDARRIAAENLDLMERRLEKAAEARRAIQKMRGELNLIESGIGLLRDQIVTIGSPEALAGRLDELVGSVAAIEASARETEALTRRLELGEGAQNA